MSLFLISKIEYQYTVFKLDILTKFYNPWSIAQSKKDPWTQPEDLTPRMTDIYLSRIWNSFWQSYISFKWVCFSLSFHPPASWLTVHDLWRKFAEKWQHFVAMICCIVPEFEFRNKLGQIYHPLYCFLRML